MGIISKIVIACLISLFFSIVVMVVNIGVNEIKIGKSQIFCSEHGYSSYTSYKGKDSCWNWGQSTNPITFKEIQNGKYGVQCDYIKSCYEKKVGK